MLLLVSFTLGVRSQANYEKKSFNASDGTTIPYRLLTPEKSKEAKKYPLVLFMHGAGERGNDNEKQLIHGSAMFENPVNREEHPAFVLYPQCPEDRYWAFPERPAAFIPDQMPLLEQPTAMIRGVYELVQSYLQRPEVDKKRVYIIGLSMGAMATYELVGRYPQLFAAAIPICGIVHPDRLLTAKKVKFRIYHGDADNVVPVEGSRSAYRTLRSIGAEVEYFELPGVNHGSWNPAFNMPDFMEWLFDQHQ